MHLCRSALQRLAPLTQRSSATLLRNAPARQMSASSVPGSSGQSLPYYLFVGVTATAAGVYVYRTLTRDTARFQERDEIIGKNRAQMEILKEQSKTVEAEEVSETLVKAVEAPIEEAATEEVAVQEEVQVASTSLEPEQAVTEEEASPAPAEVEQAVTEEETSPPAPAEVEQTVTEEETSPPAPAEEEPAVIVEASAQKVKEEIVEPVAEDVPAETPPVLEASSDNIPEELASAVAEEDWSELSARKPEEAAEDSTAAGEEVKEAVEAEVSASS